MKVILNSIFIIALSITPSSVWSEPLETTKTFEIKPKAIKWYKHEPYNQCTELTKPQRFPVKFSKDHPVSLDFSFKGQTYSPINRVDDKQTFDFEYAADTDGLSETMTIKVSGKIVNQKMIGQARIDIKKDVSSLKPGTSDQWTKHQYNCRVEYSF